MSSRTCKVWISLTLEGNDPDFLTRISLLDNKKYMRQKNDGRKSHKKNPEEECNYSR